ncbi:MAG: DUF2254 domain-containing protein [Acidimicrobiales bacterium]|nr:DUF2254 domain-containing protein [Acidimicrobiales bacterium]
MQVRLRQLTDQVLNRFFAIPMLFVGLGAILSLLVRAIDTSDLAQSLPTAMQTTVQSGRVLLATIAGGLLTSVTLLLSLMLVAVQLASTQYSPRTLRNWIGDKTLQITVGVVLGTSVFCLLVLRDTRRLSEGTADTPPTELVPHVGVLVAVALGIVSLILVVKSVDHLADSLRVGRVGQRIMAATLSTIQQRSSVAGGEGDARSPVVPADTAFPDHAEPVTTPQAGWVQQVDIDALLEAMPSGATSWIAAPLGDYVLPDAPLVWTTADTAECEHGIRDAFAIGDTRTMQQDAAYGILRLTDIAVRALSPGVNDPNTAADMVAHLNVILLRLWELPPEPSHHRAEDRTVIVTPVTHAEYLHLAFDPIRRYGAADPVVIETLVRALTQLVAEVERRDLPGPTEPLVEMVELVRSTADRTQFSPQDRERLDAIADPQS